MSINVKHLKINKKNWYLKHSFFLLHPHIEAAGLPHTFVAIMIADKAAGEIHYSADRGKSGIHHRSGTA